jgi:hypothetical protein
LEASSPTRPRREVLVANRAVARPRVAGRLVATRTVAYVMERTAPVVRLRVHAERMTTETTQDRAAGFVPAPTRSAVIVSLIIHQDARTSRTAVSATHQARLRVTDIALVLGVVAGLVDSGSS